MQDTATTYTVVYRAMTPRGPQTGLAAAHTWHQALAAAEAHGAEIVMVVFS